MMGLVLAAAIAAEPFTALAADTSIVTTEDGKVYCQAADGSYVYGVQEVDGKTYYFPEDGVLQYGWNDFGDQISFVKRDFSIVTNAVVEGAQIDENGNALTPVTEAYDPTEESTMTDVAFYEEIQSLIDSITTDDMTNVEKLRAVYDYEIANFSYLRNPAIPSGDWTTTYAQEILSTGRGNCFRYTAVFAYCARALGYDVRIVTGYVNDSPHGLPVLTIDGTDYICDPVMADGRKDPEGFWMHTWSNYKRPFVAEREWIVVF